MPTTRPQDALSTANPDQIKPAQPFMVGSYMDAETYFKSPYYSDSYYFPFNPDPLCRGNNYKVYDEMRDDDQVKVAISFKKDIVVNAGWQITCADPRVMEFVTISLKRMQEDGSLQMSFEDVLRDMLGSYEYGFSLSEPIFKIKDGMYVYDSIRVRPPQSFRFKVDDFGTTVEIIQMSNRGELYFDPKLFMHHIYQVEYGNPYGKSDLRAAHKAWVAKKHITKFLAIYLERFASPLVVGRYQANDDTDELDKLNTALKSIQQTTTLIIPESAQIEFVQANKDSSETYIKALNYYNMHIARALLVPDLLGISGEKTHGGSYALGQDQFKMFLATIEKDRQSLARKITLRLINPLVTANFGPGLKCDFEFVPYSMDDHTELMKIWSSLATGQVFKPSEDEINHLRKQLKFPEGPVDVVTQPPVPQTPQPSGQGTMKFGQRPIVRRTHFQGIPVNVEIEPGQQKCGIGPDGTAWSHTYKYPYGEIAGTKGHDGDPVDVYLGPDEDAGQVHVVHQNDHLGKYDEDKVFLGFPSPQDAERAYREHGPEFGFGKMDSMSLDEFRNGYMASGRSNFAARRALTSYEKKVDFAQIQKSMDDAESSLSKRLKSTARQIWGSYLAQIKDSGLIRNFNPQRLTEIKPKFLKDMNLELKHGFRELLGMAYDEARHELFPDSPRKYGLEEGELEYGDMMAVLDTEAFNITADYSGLTSKKINSTIVQGLKQGLSESEIAARIREEMPDVTDTWIDTLVRTKTTEIYNRGRKSYFDNDELAQKVIGGYQYSAILDARTTEICRSLDKRVYREDDPNINLLTPPLHWNAIAEGQLVLTQRGQVAIENIVKGDKVWTHMGRWANVYDTMSKPNDFDYILNLGDAESGMLLTPDHPILSNGHWIAAGDLREGDHVGKTLKESVRPRTAQSGIIIETQHSIPSTMKFVISAQKFLHTFMSAPFTDLDKNITDAKVDHPGINNLLEIKNVSSVMQYFTQMILWLCWIPTKIISHTFGHPFSDVLIPAWVIGPHALGMSSIDRTCFLCEPESGVDIIGAGANGSQGKARRFPLATNFYSKFPAPIENSIGVFKPEASCNRTDRFGFTKMSLRDHGIEGDGVINIHVEKYNISTVVNKSEKVAYSGMVYNLAVEGDESYVVNGFIVHNCRSVIVPVTRYETDDLSDADEVPDRKELQGMGANLLSIKAEVKR